MTTFRFDPASLRDLRSFARDCGDLPEKVAPDVRAVLQRGALNIKAQLVAEAQGVEHAPHFPRSITYDTTVREDGITAEIGPDKDLPGRQGALANLLYFGRADTAPRLPDPAGALEREAPAVERYLAEALAGLL